MKSYYERPLWKALLKRHLMKRHFQNILWKDLFKTPYEKVKSKHLMKSVFENIWWKDCHYNVASWKDLYIISTHIFYRIYRLFSLVRYLKLPVVDSPSLRCIEKFGHSIQILDVSGLKIRKLPDYIFLHLPQLTWLDLR